jgi:hypothetical protein
MAATSGSVWTPTNIAPSPSHFATRTPKSVALSRTAVRNCVRTRTDSSSPWASVNRVNPQRSTKAKVRSTRMAAFSPIFRGSGAMRC